LAQHDPSATATHAVAQEGPRWMGQGRPKHPWRVAQELLRSDLRPAVLTVVDGTLRVGFRGPAADALGDLASRWTPGGLEPMDWVDTPLISGPLEACSIDDPEVVSVLPGGALRRAR